MLDNCFIFQNHHQVQNLNYFLKNFIALIINKSINRLYIYYKYENYNHFPPLRSINPHNPQ